MVVKVRYNYASFIIQTNSCWIVKIPISSPLPSKTVYKVLRRVHVELLYSVIQFICHWSLIIINECHVSWTVQLPRIISLAAQWSQNLSFFTTYYYTVVEVVCDLQHSSLQYQLDFLEFHFASVTHHQLPAFVPVPR